MSHEQVHAQSDEAALRRRVRDVMHAGTLPSRPPDGTWGGHGVGAACAVCMKSIGEEELEFEIEFGRNGGSPNRSTHHLHVRCFEAWELERDQEPQIRNYSRVGSQGAGNS
jgi:hypothetical protein